MNLKNTISNFGLLLLICSSFGFTSCFSNAPAVAEGGYVDVIPFQKGFIAITNNGRIDWLSHDGRIAKSKAITEHQFTGVLMYNDQIIISGDKGLATLNLADTSLHNIPLATAQAVNCIASFKGFLVAGMDGATLNVGTPEGGLKPVVSGLKGNIMAFCTNNSKCFGVTDQGEIIHSADGLQWEVFDFNTVYSGYYKPCSFTGVFATANQIAVVGKKMDGAPALFFSNKGSVWTERPLMYEDESGRRMNLDDAINDIYYEQAFDQFILVTEGGKVMTIPSCSHCHKLYPISANGLNCITGVSDAVLIAGKDGFIKIINAEFL